MSCSEYMSELIMAAGGELVCRQLDVLMCVGTLRRNIIGQGRILIWLYNEQLVS